MADGGFVCPYKYLLDVHSELCPGSMQHLQHVHNFVRPGLQYLLDMQLVSVRMLDLLKLFGRARRDSGILSGNSGTTLFDLLGERHNSADNLCGTNADSKGTNTRGTFHTGERWPRHATAKLAEYTRRDQRPKATSGKSAGECCASGQHSPSYKRRAR